MSTRMQQRRGLSTQWTEVNPVLAAGEIGFETDTNKFKIGDDVNPWNDLPYFLNVEELNNGGALDEYVLSEEVGISIAQLVDGKVPASQLNLVEYAKTSEVTTAVNNAVSGLVDGAPDLLNTLNELAAAVQDDDDFATTVTNQIATKANSDNPEFTVDTLSEIFYSGTAGAMFPSTPRILNVMAFSDPLYPPQGTVFYIDSPLVDGIPLIAGTVSDMSPEWYLFFELQEADNSAHISAITNYLGSSPSTIRLLGNATATITATELSTLNGVTSSIQTQIDGKAATSHTHTVADITDITVDAAAINSLDGAQGNIQDQLDDKSDVGHIHTLSDITDVIASFTEVNRLAGVTSNVQDQLDSKQDEITGAASSIISSDLTADRALLASGNGKIAASAVTKAELEHLTGVTSGIQSQLNGKSANGHTHEISDISGLIDVTASQINFLGGAFPVTSAIQPQLNGKASSSHTHTVANVTGLQTELDSKLNLSGGTMTGKIILDGDPTQAMHAATKDYVDSVAEGLHIHEAVVAATTANISLSNAPSSIDGVSLSAGDRVLVKNQTTLSENGIYTYAVTGVMTRAEDFDSPSEVDGGDFVFVLGGNEYDNTGWVQVTSAVTIIGTDPIEFTQFSGAGSITAGTNISVVGTQVSTVASPTFSDVTVSGTLTLGNAGVLAGVDLDKLSDVVLTSPGMGDSLVHNGTGFVNTHVDSIPSRIKQASLTTNAYTLNETADVGRVVEVFNSSPTTINIPANDTFHPGTMIVIMQSGSGQVTVNYSTGTLNSTPGNKLRTQWSVATLLKRSEGSWLLYGDLVA